ncbi:hypothetical protein JXA40_10750 [bacterium]|nr:hypothetical protein [candidate division CSSED10-310 bacterium]
MLLRKTILPFVMSCLMIGLVGCAGDIHPVRTDSGQPDSPDNTILDGTPVDIEEMSLDVKIGAGNPNRYNIVTERNLFSRDRMFDPEAASRGKPPTPTPRPGDLVPDGLRVAGTIILENPLESMAFIVDAKDREARGKAKQLKIGDTIQGYEIAQLRDDAVILDKDGVSVTLNVSPIENRRQDPRKGHAGSGRSGGQTRYTRTDGSRVPPRTAGSRQPGRSADRSADRRTTPGGRTSVFCGR